MNGTDRIERTMGMGSTAMAKTESSTPAIHRRFSTSLIMVMTLSIAFAIEIKSPGGTDRMIGACSCIVIWKAGRSDCDGCNLMPESDNVHSSAMLLTRDVISFSLVQIQIRPHHSESFLSFTQHWQLRIINILSSSHFIVPRILACHPKRSAEDSIIPLSPNT